MQITQMLLATAHRWRTSNPECKGGVVLIWQGKAYGWKDSLRDPWQEKPGAFAVDLAGLVFTAQGGSVFDGAKSWERYTEPSQ